MHVPCNISDEAADAVVELLFHNLRALDDRDLRRLIRAIFRIMSREVQRAAQHERERIVAASEN
jgi:hypothetical protein